MRLHVLPGDAVAGDFKKTNIDGDVVVCRECLVAGPIDADPPFEFWEQRAKFILGEYGEDEIEYHERVADELEQLREVVSEAEVCLWFEYELFCSVNMWFCLSLLRDTGAKIYRVEPIVRNREDRWKGFGGLDADELRKCYDRRKRFTDDDINLGTNLWEAFRHRGNDRMLELGNQENERFPYLKEVCEAAAAIDSRPAEILDEIVNSGLSDFGEIFVEFSRRAGEYGFGDLQVQDLIDQRAS